jgi:hypothetical protein
MKQLRRDAAGLCYATIQLKSMTDHSKPVTDKEVYIERREERESINKNRNKKEGFPLFKDGIFNCDPAPWGFNYMLGYCESSNNFLMRD